MQSPSLTFFCELEEPKLVDLFSSNSLIQQLSRMGANVSMGMQDFSAERAKIVKKLTKAGVPVTAWLLLPREEGYWTNLDTIPQTVARYYEFRKWSAENQLTWAAVGLDIEPKIDFLTSFIRNPVQQIPYLLKRFFSQSLYREYTEDARSLIRQIHSDGFAVEVYQFPFVLDERAARSTVFTRLLGTPPLEADREVLMLYSSFFGSQAEAILWNYARQASAVGLGSTGGGVEIEGVPPLKTLRWIDLKHDLLLAHQSTNRLYIFSLEGCVANNYLDRLEAMDWTTPIAIPSVKSNHITFYRKVIQTMLWILSHPIQSVLLSSFLIMLFTPRKRN